MAGIQLAPAELLSQEQSVSAPSSADFSYHKASHKQAPKDELTGLPLSIFYGPQHLSLPRNYQHGWHSKNRLKKELPFSWAEALRASVGYLIPIKFHENGSPYGYHRAIVDGPELPTELDELFSVVSLGVSGVVPRQSINLTHTPGEYSILELNNRQHRFIAHPARAYSEWEYHSYIYRQPSRDKIGRFFAEYSITRKLEQGALSPTEEEILWDPRQPLTRELGSLVYKATRETLNDLMPPVIEKFKAARKEGMVNRKAEPRTRILSYMPEHRFGGYFYAVREGLCRETVPLQTGVDEVELAA